MAAVLAYTLPTLQLVCNLVVSGPPGNNVTDSVPATTQSPTQIQTGTLPDGYTAYPDIGFAYKYHGVAATWIKAKNLCSQEGAQLAVIDSAKKMEYIGRERPSEWLLAGIVKLSDSSPWVNANTGDPIQEIIWRPGSPDGSGTCLEFYSGSNGLHNLRMLDEEEYFCQIPISLISTITVNTAPTTLQPFLSSFFN